MPENTQMVGKSFDNTLSWNSWELRDFTRSMVDFQKSALEQHNREVTAQKEDWLKKVYVSSLNAKDHWVAQECNSTVRLWLVSQKIREYFAKPENWWYDYTNVDDDVLYDNFVANNPSIKKQMDRFVLDDSQICDPTQLYYDVGLDTPPEPQIEPDNLYYDTQRSRRQVYTPQDEELNDNLLWKIPLTDWKDVEDVYKDSSYPYLEAAVDNFWASFYNFVSDIWDIVFNIWDALKAIPKTAIWIWANITGSDDYIEGISKEKLKNFYEEANNMADWLWDWFLWRRWGTDENWELNNFRDWIATIGNTFFTDPVWAFDDVAQFIEGWAWLTKNVAKSWVKNASKIWLKEWTKNTLTNIAKTSWKIENIANKAAPSSLLFSPFQTVTDLKKNAGKAWDKVSSTKPWKIVKQLWNEIWDYISKSEKMKSFRKLADTKLWKLIFPEAQDIYRQLAPMTPTQIADFERKYWVKYWDYLNKYWIKWNPQEIVDQLQYINDWLYKNISEWIAKIEEPIKITWENAEYMKDMLRFDIQHSAYVTSPTNKMTKKLYEIYNKFVTTWEMSAAELLFAKRYFERKAKFTYWKSAKVSAESAAKREKATNIDSAAREILIDHAEKNGFVWLRDMSKEIQRNRAIIDWVWINAMKWYWNSALWLSDVLLAVADYDEKALSIMALKWILNSKYMKELQLKLWNKLRWIKPTKFTDVDLDEIRKINAENRTKDWISSAFWDWTPRLTDDVKWWVVATDNQWWANMRYEDAIADADKIIETYAHTPRDVAKEVVEWKDVTPNPKNFTQTDLFSSIVN